VKKLILIIFLIGCNSIAGEAPHPEILNAKTEFVKKIRSTITCTISITRSMTEQTRTNRRTKSIQIRESYWNNLNDVAKRVTVIRELIHCELGLPYLVGVSIMNKRITQAVNAYVYGAE